LLETHHCTVDLRLEKLGMMPFFQDLSEEQLREVNKKSTANHYTKGETIYRQGLLIQLPLSRKDLADMAGTSTATASRVMSRFQEDKLIEVVEQSGSSCHRICLFRAVL
ncbi:MAG: helix-turn-helix domain-containing protein, partial [Balneolaceae bacterium]